MTYNQQRVLTYKNWWNELVERYGNLCFYCKEEVATTINYKVPYAQNEDNAIENLIPSCAFCNSLASNKLFDTCEQKRAYIMKQREKYKNMRTICTECLLPFTYRAHSPSLFLCAECYDQEYDTEYSKTEGWQKWLSELNNAGTMHIAHKVAKQKIGRYSLSNKENFMATLIDEYAQLIGNDDSFFESLAGVI